MTLLQGDCIEVMATLDEDSVDAIVTDPPYGISFMGKHWDSSFIDERTEKRDVSKLGVRLPGGHDSPDRKTISRTGSAFANKAGTAGSYDFSLTGNRAFHAWCEAWAVQALRVLKPGGHALVFGGPRTYHRLASGMEDAGFEIRDCIAWLYGSGFPKSLNLDGEHKGWGTALKPAHEPIVVARKPLTGTVAANVMEHGTGALNVDGCRVEGQPHAGGEHGVSIYGSDGNYEPGPNVPGNESGRWPANVVLDEEAAAMLDEQTGELPPGYAGPNAGGIGAGNVYGRGNPEGNYEGGYGDTGGASRFFYCAKASRAERNAGLEGFETTTARNYAGGALNRLDHASSDGIQRTGDRPPRSNHHPTVKPIDLMRWLVRLVTPPGGLVLDPFAGSGTTLIAADLEGFSFLGIEREAEYIEIAKARVAHWQARQLELGAA